MKKGYRGCDSCKNYSIGKFGFDTDIPSKCLLGKDTEFEAWWCENGKKHHRDLVTDMECFEETEFGVILDKLSGVLDELKSKL